MRRIQVILLLTAVGLAAGLMLAGCSRSQSPAKSAAAGSDWPAYGNNLEGNHFSPLKQITAENVGHLGLAWSLDIDAPMGLAAEPIEVNGVIYLSAPQSRVYAVDAVSGKLRWKFDPHVQLGISTQNSYAVRVNRGVAVANGKVYVSTGDCRLFAIDATSGQKMWASQICDPSWTGSTGAPLVAAGKVFIGYNGADDMSRGSLVAFDAQTGKLAWRFWTVPGNPAHGFESKALEVAAKTWKGKNWWRFGGGEVWGAISYDPQDHLVIFGTSGAGGTEGTTPRDEHPTGAKLYSASILAVNPDTGQLVWHYQATIPSRSTEVMQVVIADITLNGAQRHVAMAVPKNGTFYVLDAKTGQFLSSKPMVDFQAAKSQGGQAAAVQTFEPWLDRLSPRGFRWTVHNWWPMSYSPATGLVYVPTTDRRQGPTPAGQLPFIGRLVAWNPASQMARWSVAQPIASNSGVLSTAGNLVFQGQGTGEFDAYSADKGEKLWSIQTGSAIDAVPVSFAVGGQQYIVVPVGWGSGSRTFGTASMMATPQSKRGPSRLLAFRLGAKMPFPTPPDIVPPVPQPPPQTASQATIRQGARLYQSHLCGSCHSPHLDGSGAWVENGAIPDLRYAPPRVHREWAAIVLAGTHRKQGMLAFGKPLHHPDISPLNASQAAAIHAYVIATAWKAYTAQQHHRQVAGAAR